MVSLFWQQRCWIKFTA